MKLSAKRKREIDREFSRIMRELEPEIYRYCFLKLKNEQNAMDCTQNAFLVLYNRMMTGEPFRSPKAFLYKTAKNFVYREYTTEQKDLQRLVYYDADDNPEAEMLQSENEIENFIINPPIDEEEFRERIKSRMTKTDVEVFILRQEQKMSMKQMAEELGISVSAVKLRLMRMRQRARIIFKEELEKYYP